MRLMNHRAWRYTAACDLDNLRLPDWTLPGGPLQIELQAILYSRGYSDEVSAGAFLMPERYHPTLPSELPNLDRAIRLLHRFEVNQKVLVWGDFDADGQTSTAMLIEALDSLDFDVVYYIPDRLKESHGVHLISLSELLEEHQPDLLLICDTGSTAVESVDYANELEIPVIIADHHEIVPPLPHAEALVNPQMLRNPEHPLWTLSGAGVCYLLLEALYHAKGRKNEAERFLDLACIGLIADVVEQVHDTRYLIQRGLRVLQSTKRVGLVALAAQLELDLLYITSGDVAFKIAPALNAFGRLDSANLAVELLTTTDTVRAQELAAMADSLNQKRRMMTQNTLEAVYSMVQQDPSLLEWETLVLSHPHWHGGIVGIVAAQLTETYQKPVALLVEGEDGMARGSIRSVAGYPVGEALQQLDDILLSYGGHTGAGGLSIGGEHLPKLRRRLSQAFADVQTSDGTPALEIEGFLALEALTLDFALDLERLAPFGAGNPRPVFASRDVEVRSIAKLGRNEQHRRLIIENADGTRQRILWWNSGDIDPPIGRINLAYTLSISMFQGERQFQLELVDWTQISLPDADKQTAIDVIDYRTNRTDFENVLMDVFAEYPQATIWAEGFPTSQNIGAPLSKLLVNDTLIIVTAPPNDAQLRQALERVQPRRVVLIGVNPPIHTLPEFLKLQWGLTETVIRNANGMVNINRFMERLGQSKIVVKMGLEYLEAMGKITVDFGARTRLEIKSGTNQQSSDVQAVEKRLRVAWEEVEAYRRYLERVDAYQLINGS